MPIHLAAATTFQLQTGNESSDSWNGEVQSVCLLACSRNRAMKMLFPIYNYSHPQFFSLTGAEEEVPDGLLLP